MATGFLPDRCRPNNTVSYYIGCTANQCMFIILIQYFVTNKYFSETKFNYVVHFFKQFDVVTYIH